MLRSATRLRSKVLRIGPALVPCAALLLATAPGQVARADVEIPAGGVEITFDGFDGSGFAPDPAAGQLDSDDWSVLGLSDGDLDFGQTGDGGDYARGIEIAGVATGGVYAFDVDVTGNYALGVQPGGDDFTPGSFTLRLVNQSGATAADLEVAYTVWVNNDQPRSNSLTLSYSLDGVDFIDVPALDLLTPEAADANGFVSTPRATTLPDIDVPVGGQIWLRWSSDDVSGSGSRDEIAIDDIQVTAVEPCPGQVAWGGFTTSRLNYAGASLAGTVHSSLRQTILDNDGCIRPMAPTLTPEYLADVDVFYTSLLSDGGTLSADEQAALADWLAAGGTLVVTADNVSSGSYESFTQAYGVTGYVAASVGTASVTVAHPLTTDVTTIDPDGVADFSYGADAQELATTDGNTPMLVLLDPSTNYCGGGRIVVYADHNVFNDTGILDADNATLANDLAAWVGTEVGDCCGNGFPNEGEACDDGNDDDTDACLSTCEEASCGDGVVWAGMEECDDGNDDDTDDCLNTCVAASCGDGVVWAGMEECDDGNEDDTDDCLSDCTIPMAGSTGGETDGTGTDGTGTTSGGDTGTTGGDPMGTTGTEPMGTTGDETAGTTGGSETSGPATATATVTVTATAGETTGTTDTEGGGTDTDGVGEDTGDDGCGCATDRPRQGALGSLLGLLGLAVGRRRRR